jgi:hypothetical protein
MRLKILPGAHSTLALLALWATTSVIVLLPGQASAQDEAALREARGKFQKGIELEHAKNWAGALKIFREVGQIKMTPQVRYHIATCEENLGQLVAALGGYELALAQSEDMHPNFIAEVQGSIDDLRARIPKLIIERGEGAEAATIELDGVQLGENSMGAETPVDPGPHTVTATAQGYEPYRKTIKVSEGAVETVSITLLPEPKAAAKPNEGEATLVVDSKARDYGPWPYVAGGVGAAGIVLGTTFLVLSQGKVGKLKKLCGDNLDCSSLVGSDLDDAQKLDKQAHSFEAVGWVGIGVGVVGLGAGAYMLLTGKPKSESPEAARLALQPYAPRSDAGLSLVGAF